MDEVQAKHETVVITKRGKPVAKLVRMNTETDEIYSFRARVLLRETLFRPATTTASTTSVARELRWGDLSHIS